MLRKLLLCLGLAFCGTVHAAATTNFSDQWWAPSESGWGASVLQQKDVLFVDLFIYGADTKPTWYTASIFQQSSASGHVVFTGDLYATSGPWFGGPFNPASVATRKVGTLTFDADSSDTATLSYSVDGVLVAKRVTRQPWAYENFTGNYYGGTVYDLSQCTNPAGNGHQEDLGAISITHTGNSTFAMTTQSATAACNWNGVYAQAGHMGNVVGSFACNNGVSGNFSAFELEKSISGFNGRFVASDNLGCLLDGRLGGVQR